MTKDEDALNELIRVIACLSPETRKGLLRSVTSKMGIIPEYEELLLVKLLTRAEDEHRENLSGDDCSVSELLEELYGKEHQ